MHWLNILKSLHIFFVYKIDLFTRHALTCKVICPSWKRRKRHYSNNCQSALAYIEKENMYSLCSVLPSCFVIGFLVFLVQLPNLLGQKHTTRHFRLRAAREDRSANTAASKSSTGICSSGGAWRGDRMQCYQHVTICACIIFPHVDFFYRF